MSHWRIGNFDGNWWIFPGVSASQWTGVDSATRRHIEFCRAPCCPSSSWSSSTVTSLLRASSATPGSGRDHLQATSARRHGGMRQRYQGRCVSGESAKHLNSLMCWSSWCLKPRRTITYFYLTWRVEPDWGCLWGVQMRSNGYFSFFEYFVQDIAVGVAKLKEQMANPMPFGMLEFSCVYATACLTSSAWCCTLFLAAIACLLSQNPLYFGWNSALMTEVCDQGWRWLRRGWDAEGGPPFPTRESMWICWPKWT